MSIDHQHAGTDTELSFAELQAPIQWVRGPRALEHLAEALRQVPHFAIDTETGGVAQLKEPLNARLSLIQLYIPRRDRWGNISASRGRLVVIDVLRLEELALQRDGDHAILEPLREVLSDPAIKKIIHHEAFERDQFERRRLQLNGVIDTERMSRRLRSDLLSHSLGAVDYEVRQIALDKGLQDSQWLKRPLDTEQIRYAALDPQETYHVWRALHMIESAISVDCEASLESYCVELSRTRAMHAELLANHNLDQICPRLERARELVRDKIKESALENSIGSEQEGDRVTFSSQFGSIVVGPHRTNRIDIDKLTSLHPHIAQEVIRLSCTQDELNKALREQGYDAKQARQTVAGLYYVGSSSIGVSVQPDVVDPGLSDPEICDLFGLSADQSPQLLLQKLVLLSAQTLTLKRQAGIANQLATLERRAEMLEGLIQEEVTGRALTDNLLSRFEHQGIEITVKRSAHRQLDILKLRTEHPELADRLLRPVASLKDLRAAFGRRGLTDSETDALVDQVTQVSIGADRASVSIYPHYAIIYQFSRPSHQTDMNGETATAA